MRIKIPVCELEYDEEGNTLWVHSPLGATVLRLKTSGIITSRKCVDSPTSHVDIVTNENIEVCLSRADVPAEFDKYQPRS